MAMVKPYQYDHQATAPEKGAEDKPTAGEAPVKGAEEKKSLSRRRAHNLGWPLAATTGCLLGQRGRRLCWTGEGMAESRS